MAISKRWQFKYTPRHEKRCKDWQSLTRNMLAGFLGIEPEDLRKLRYRGFILAPTHKCGKAPQWRKAEVIEWLKAGGPSRDEWEDIKRQRRTGVSTGNKKIIL